MYWGAADQPRSGADDPKRRVRRLTVAFAATLLSVGGTVAMASASTPHAGAASAVSVSTPLPEPDRVTKPRPVATTAAPRPAPTTPPTTARPRVVTPPPTSPPTTAPRSASESAAVASALQTRSTVPAAAPLAGSNTCGAALAYLAAHSAPGFRFECPGYALGHQAMTCINVAGVCPGEELIVISVVCPASYMNEAHNSWIEAGLAQGAIDPYGYCH